jgi:hypothetical protein
MSAPKHTPGPWRWLGGYALIGDHGKRPCILAPLRSRAEPGNYKLGFRNDRGTLEAVDAFDDHPDARLIAAAPELLAACKTLFEELTMRFDGAPDSRTRWMGEHVERLRAAIAKAEGSR